MAKKNQRYKQMERRMTGVLAVAIFLFILFLIAAGAGIIWLKVVSAILAILISVLCIVFLYLTKEIFTQRSLWMTTAAASIVVCIIFSLLLNFPSPDPYQANSTSNTTTSDVKN